jgi:ribonuclease BN (tRNA processing enzyme)
MMLDLFLPRAVEARAVVLAFIAVFAIPTAALAQTCTGSPVALQILGSGGPRTSADRASSAYVLWIEGQARLLVDMGGGALLRFGQAHVRISDLSLVAISHLHPDHVADLPALLWLSHEARKQPLRVVGPSGNEQAPSFPVFLARLFDGKNGAFPLLAPALGGAQADHGGSVRLEVDVVDVTKAQPSTVFEQDGMKVMALGIPHGNVPTLAYRVDTRGVAIVLSSDQTGTSPAFIEFARGAHVLVMHLAVAAERSDHPLHASPAVVGRVAQEARVGRLIVSHMGLFDLDAAIAELTKFYAGPLTVGADLQCTQVR